MAARLDAARAFIESITGYSITRNDLLEEALDVTGLRAAQSNQRLALIGDVRLKAVILDAWYPKNSPKGSRRRSGSRPFRAIDSF